MLNIMVVDDDRVLNGLFKRVFEKEHNVSSFYNVSSALENLEKTSYDVILSDIKMPDGTGLDILEASKRRKSDAYVILMTGFANIDEAVSAIKNGAMDYLIKPVDPHLLETKIKLIDENISLKKTVYSGNETPVFKSSSYGEVLRLALRVAETDTTTLLTGETGSGKGVLARYIHNASPCKNKYFIPVNCANFQENIFETELFGYKKGAFTGAAGNKPGIVAIAAGGTLFFDEIGEVPLHFQAKLLKFLEDKTYLPVGGSEYETSEARIIAATNRNLEGMVREGLFREDLYYRLNVININIPPLRERKEDIIPLACFFINKYSHINPGIKGLSENASELLVSYSFPGNVRELSNIIERAMILERTEYISAPSVNILKLNIKDGKEAPADLKTLEKNHILKILQETGNDKSKASAILGIDRTTLYRKLKEYGFK